MREWLIGFAIERRGDIEESKKKVFVVNDGSGDGDADY